MTPEEYFGGRPFRIVESKRWPPNKKPCFAEFLHHRDGEDVFYIRGIMDARGYYVRDVIAIDAFGGGCHFCVFSFAEGLFTETGHFEVRHSTTQRKMANPHPWGNLCERCRIELAELAKKKYLNTLKALNIDPHKPSAT